ncbi:hypothetical protein SAMN05660866_02852 [Maribacter arcticus]|uniref:Uncharacterized protein n=1 Tax=Maribacter arcticus TaxID=561365 RepID=A0A1T5DEF6_9FLAO|nr:hypothetical protein SAMN05660866_02852 [Maribacter arcticus]
MQFVGLFFSGILEGTFYVLILEIYLPISICKRLVQLGKNE